MTMKTSTAGRRFIEKWEGLYLKTYNDGVGVATIGYGHTTAAGPPKVYYGQTITQQEADSILAADLAKVEAEVTRMIKGELNQNQFDALISFQFNTGKLAESTLLKKLNAGQYDAVPTELMKWDHAGGRQMEGLTRRRRAEGVLWMSAPTVPAPPDVPKPEPIPPAPQSVPQPNWLLQLITAIINLLTGGKKP